MATFSVFCVSYLAIFIFECVALQTEVQSRATDLGFCLRGNEVTTSGEWGRGGNPDEDLRGRYTMCYITDVLSERNLSS